MVNRTSGPPEEQLHERHDASDFETKTGQDRRAPATSVAVLMPVSAPIEALA
jgi:hypothetical protein